MTSGISSQPPGAGSNENLSFKAADGYPLAATLFRPSGPVLTYDYRGTMLPIGC